MQLAAHACCMMGMFSCIESMMICFAGIRLNRMAVLTAHQMGSARIGVSREASVCDPAGQCWDVQGLYVADASALPTSTGDPAILLACTVCAAPGALQALMAMLVTACPWGHFMH
jgi:choline dehydrogenase-like flavoprotein